MAAPAQTSRRTRGLVALACALVVAIASLADGPLWMDRPVYDFLVRSVLPPAKVTDRVVFVDIDDETLQAVDQRWPLQRRTWATLVSKLSAFKPAVIVLDAFFPEPAPRQDVELALQVADRIYDGGLDEDPAGKALVDFLEKEAAKRDADRRFATALSEAGNVILGLVDAEEMPDALNATPAVDLPALPGIPSSTRLPQRMGTPRGSIAPLTMAALRQASVHVPYDGDAVVRRYGYAANAGLSHAPSLALAAVQVAEKERAAEIGARLLKMDGGAPLLRWVNVDKVRRIRLLDLFEAEADNATLKEALKDRIVMVGVSALGASDRRATPLRSHLPGTYVHVVAATNLLANDHIVASGPLTRALGMLGVLLCLIVALLGTRLRNGAAVTGMSLGAMAIWAVVAVVALLEGRLLPMVPVWAGVLVPTVVELATRTNHAEAARQRIRDAFSMYLAPAVVEELVADPDSLRLGGQRREITALFSDVAGFTTISEQLDPAQLTDLLNAYLSEMTDIVLQEGGTIDKYIGDAIVAMFGAPLSQPDHAARACRAAIRCAQRLDELRDKWVAEGWPEIHARIGVNSGVAVVGNMGSEKRFDYTMLGDMVNLAARLEGTNKVYGTDVMVGESTAALVQGQIALRELDRVAVKGKNEPVSVFEGLSPGPEVPEALRERVTAFGRGLQAWRDCRWQDAHEAFSAAAAAGDRPAQVFLERLAAMGSARPAPGWDGVFKMTTK